MAVDTTVGLEVWDTATWELRQRSVRPVLPSGQFDWSPDGSYIAIASTDGFIIWDVQLNEAVQQLAVYAGREQARLLRVLWSPDGNKIVTAHNTNSGEGQVRVWDVRSGTTFFQFSVTTALSLSWAPDSNRLAVVSRDGLSVVDVAQRQTLYQARPAPGLMSVAWSPVDNDRIASSYAEGPIRILDASAAEVVQTLPGPVPGPAALTFTLRWSPNGRYLAASVDNASVAVWEVRLGEIARTLPGEGWALAWSPDSGTLVTRSNDRAIRLWSIPAGTLVKTLSGYSRPVNSVAWSPDGRRVAWGSEDKVVAVWDLSAQALAYTFEHTEAVLSVAWSPDGTQLVSGSRDSTRVWSIADGRLLRTLNGISGTLSPDGTRIAGLLARQVRIWNAETGALVTTLPVGLGVEGFAWSPDGRRLALVDGYSVVIWDLAGKTALTRLQYQWLVHSVLWSPDGRLVAGASIVPAFRGLRTTVRLWDATEGTLRAEWFVGGTMRLLAWSPDSRYITTDSAVGGLTLWDVQSRQSVGYFRWRTPVSVSWAPDGGRLASASGDGTVRLWGPMPQVYMLPQVAVGGDGLFRIQTRLILTNPSRTPALAYVAFTDETAQPFSVTFGGFELGSYFRVELLPGATRIVPVERSGPLQGVAARVLADAPIGVSDLFSFYNRARLVSEAGVLHAPGLDRFTVPVDNSEGARVGVALFNPSTSAAMLTLRRFGLDGRPEGSPVTVTLEAGAHRASFVDELFAQMPAGLRGAVTAVVEPPGVKVSAVALRLSDELLATLPVLEVRPGPTTQALLPQVANGQAGDLTVKTTFILTNLSGAGTTARLTLTDDAGAPFAVTIPELGRASTFDLDLPTGHTRIYHTDGIGDLSAGAATVAASGPVGVSSVFSLYVDGRLLSQGGVLDAPARNDFTVPVDTRERANVGVALFNPSADMPATLTLRLLDSAGRLTARGAGRLDPKAHEARFITELFEDVPAGFRGALSVSASVPVSAIALRLAERQLSTLPVIGGAFQP